MKKLTLIPLILAAACQGTATQDEGESTAKQPAPAKTAKSGTQPKAPAAVQAPPTSERYGREGFHVYEKDGRLWVFLVGEKDHEAFLRDGEPAKNVTRVGAGPDGRTLKGASIETLDKYDAAWRFARPGFAVFGGEDGRIWVFRSGSKDVGAYMEHGEPAKSVTLIAAGPDGRTVRGAEKDELKAYCAQWRYGQPGFEVFQDDGRLWVFRSGSEGLSQYVEKGEPAKFATRVGEGPDGMTVRGAELETLADYCAAYKYAQPGFEVYGHDGRLWVFRKGSDEHKAFLAKGEPAKRVTKIGVGPGGTTVMSADIATVDDFVAPTRYASPGFAVIGRDGRLWIFRKDSDAHKAFLAGSEPVKRVTLVGAGPDGRTVLGVDREILDEYLQSGREQ